MADFAARSRPRMKLKPLVPPSRIKNKFFGISRTLLECPGHPQATEGSRSLVSMVSLVVIEANGALIDKPIPS